MDKEEIRNEINKLQRKVRMAESLLKNISKETKIKEAANIVKIKQMIEEHKTLAKLYEELL